MKPALAQPLLLVLLALTSPARADVYGFIDERGVHNYSDIPSDPRARLLWRDLNGPKAIGIPSSAGLMKSLPAELVRHIEAAASAHSIDAVLLKAVVAVESHANPKARSPKGAMGLTQLMPATAARYGVRNAYDARQNLDGGARYLRDLLKLFNNDVKLVLAAFNAGENAVIRYGHSIPPYAETKRYVPTVLEQMAIFRRQARS
ncbi:lytic transglycosylase domain-containing protein [Uliginosibacterium aquaticum]|uniref:Lytic transglycosylase domain-containing protein n=1 Tax=Uliginosibacterium aquaticum TaxID=2731212 RepID=A0ABX2ICF2_9RHOO|nr:lytic transglycosylase domain-containing protein [Uliginosibacterium aquaticum]NSL54081.1 lytic transglycosylase domain-containing protein [Uliginosibacterium aquaticum]